MKGMKRTALALALMAAFGFAGAGSVAMAQEATPTTRAIVSPAQPVDNNDDGFPWGLLGLLGLAGLMGARPHNHEVTVDRTNTTTRP